MARDAGWAVQWIQHRCPCTDACDGFPPVGGGARSQPYYVFVYQLLAGVAHVILPTNPPQSHGGGAGVRPQVYWRPSRLTVN